MGWFSVWWQEIGLIGQIMLCAAFPATLVLLLQLIMTITGAGFGGDSGSDFDSGGMDFDTDTDADLDFDTDTDFDMDADGSGMEHASGHGYGHDHHGGAKIFTVRGVVAFFAIGGWAGLAAISAGIPKLWSMQIALLAGAAAMLVASFVIRLALRMQSSGNIDTKNALSRTAVVYITIPPSRSDTGRVTMLLQERFVELEAVTDCDTAIKPNTNVEVVGLMGDDCLVVCPVEEMAAPAMPKQHVEDKDIV